VLRRLRIENLVLIREAELRLGPGLTVVTGETGAGKTIFVQAIGLLLGARGDSAIVGATGTEAYVEAEFDLPVDLADDDELHVLAELRPEGEETLVVARRVFADGRTRAYAWGRSAAREDVAAVVERLVAMSGQFEQRRLARASYGLDVLDAAAGDDQRALRSDARVAWRNLEAGRRRLAELEQDGDARRARVEELRQLVADTDALDAAEEDDLRVERDRIRHLAELAAGVAAARAALDPDDGAGALTLVAAAEAAIAPLERIAPELAAVGGELRDAAVRLREGVSELASFGSSLEAEPARLEQIEERLQLWADLRRRYRCETSVELVERRAAAEQELAGLGDADVVDAARAAVGDAERRMHGLADRLHEARIAAAAPLAAAVADELRGLGLGDGEFHVDVGDRPLGPTGRDAVTLLVRPNAGLPFTAVADTASGGELSRIALAIAAVAGGETMVFDEIDAGIGGVTAHAVGASLRRLAEHAQVLTITHLPQIATVADTHFSVEKVPGDPTHTRITVLDDTRRRDEVERMLGGGDFLASVGRGADTADR
jgi:DNA repair protein RecN (Recombination protein N)